MAKRESKIEGVNALPELGAGFTEIKKLFKAGAVPREADYVRLIEYVHYLHKLLGVEGEEDNHVPQLGNGLGAGVDGVLAVDPVPLAGVGLSATEGKLAVDTVSLAGTGLSATGGKLAVDTVPLAGTGLSATGGKLAVNTVPLAGRGISGEGNKLGQSNVAWFYALVDRFKATHYALATLPGNSSENISDADAVLLFTRFSPQFVTVRGFAMGYNMFGLDIELELWKWINDIPLSNVSRVYQDDFTFLYPDGDLIEGDITIHLSYGGGGGGETYIPIQCTIAGLDSIPVVE